MSTNWITPGLQSLIANALKYPGELYQPIFVENVSLGESFVKAVSSMAEMAGLPMVEDIVKYEELPSRGVWILQVHMLAYFDNFAEHIPENCQVILWSTELGNRLRQSEEEWLSGGIRYLASKTTPKTKKFDSLPSTLYVGLRKPGGIYNPISMVVSSHEHILPLAGSKIRMENAGLDVILTEGVEDIPHRSSWVSGNSWILSLRDYFDQHPRDSDLQEAVRGAMAEGIQTAIILDPMTFRRLSSAEGWTSILSGGVTLNFTEDPNKEGNKKRAPVLDEAWPAIGEILADKPYQGQIITTPEFKGALGPSFGNTLQWGAMGRFTGRAVIFSSKDYGYIDFQQGTIVHAGPPSRWIPLLVAAELQGISLETQEEVEALASSIVQDRICEMAEWTAATVVFKPMAPTPPMEEATYLPAESVALEMARRTDSKPRLLTYGGGYGRVWIKVEDRPIPHGLPPVQTAFWNAIDGVSSTGDIAKRIGYSYFDTLEAAVELAKKHHIYLKSDADWIEEGIGTERVVYALWSEGFLNEAYDILEGIVGRGGVTSQIAWLYAWGLVEKGNWNEAARYFEESTKNHDSQRRLIAAINSLVLKVRLKKMSHEEAYERFMAEGGRDAILSSTPIASIIAPAAAEICLRASRAGEANAIIGFIRNEEVVSKLNEIAVNH